MISIKPHHFIDILTAFGEGETDPQPHPYGHAVHSVTKEVLANRDVSLRMEFGADDICRPCCHNIHGLCDDTIDAAYLPLAPRSKREYNLMIDQRWSKRLGIQQDDILTAREFCLRLVERAGDISDLYPETPADRVAARQKNLQLGVARFLERPGSNG